MQLQWVGTAITLHGTTNTPSAYEIIRSWSNTVLDGNSTNGKDGVLFQEDNLEYGAYTLALSIARGPVTVSGANLVTGMGDLGSVSPIPPHRHSLRMTHLSAPPSSRRTSPPSLAPGLVK